MVKNGILTILSVLIFQGLGFSQDYKVVHVSGKIENGKTGSSVAVGDVLSPTDRIKVTNGKTSCLLFDGQDKLSFMNNGNTEGAVSDFFNIPPDRLLIASRGDEDSSYIAIEDYFSNDDFHMIEGEHQICLDQEYYDFNATKFVLVKDGKKSLIKTSEHTLVLNTSDLFTDGSDISSIEIYTVNTSGEFKKEVESKLILISSEDLKSQISAAIDTFESFEDENVDEIYDLFSVVYPNMNYSSFVQFVKSNF